VACGADDRLFDAGDIVCEGDALESAQRDYAAMISALLRDVDSPIGLGGGHEIAWVAYEVPRALTATRASTGSASSTSTRTDLRRPEVPGRGTSGTPFLQIMETRVARPSPSATCASA
jgi:formiminoglutamase